MTTALPPGRLRKGWRRSTPLRVCIDGAPAVSSLDVVLEPATSAWSDGRDALRLRRRINAGMALTDFAGIGFSLVVSHLLLSGSQAGPVPLPIQLAILPLGGILMLRAFALYRTPLYPRGDELRRVAGAVSVGVLAGIVASFWTGQDVSRAWIALFWLLAVVFGIGSRRAWRTRVDRLTCDGRLTLSTLIIGANEEAVRIDDALRDSRLGYHPLGYVSTRDGSESPQPDGLPVLGSLQNLDDVIRDHGVGCLFVASTAMDPGQLLSVARVARKAGADMVVSANLPEMLPSRLTVRPVGDLVTISPRPVRLTGVQAALKRAVDLGLGSALLLLTLPMWVLIALAIRLTSKGPVFFRQKRVTRGDRVFEIYKFRTMDWTGTTHADGVLDLTAPFFKLPEDPRQTRVGRFLRLASLDELPQLLNVLRGDMSLVGPRPLPAEQVAANQARLSPRHEVRAGITGWWQVNGRSDVKAEDAVGLDLFYIENWSLSLDFYILLKTVWVVLTARGAY